MKKVISIFMIVCMLLTAAGAAALGENEMHADADGWWNLLFLGGDSPSESSYDRTDSMIIVSVNVENAQIKLTSIMRDTWVAIEGHGMNKINAANVFGGPELALQTVNESFGTNLQDYVMVNMSKLVDVVDLLGGIDIEITSAERQVLGLSHAGMVHLDGKEALKYARIRKIDTDYRRTERQRTVLMALAAKLKTVPSSELPDTVMALLKLVDTNLSNAQLATLALSGFQADIEQVEQYRIPVDGTFDSGMFGSTWCIKPDFEKNAELLHEFIYGKAE